MLIVNQKLRFVATLFFVVLGSMMFSIDDSLAPQTAGASCQETQCPSGQVCCDGICIDPTTTGCCGGEPYDLDEYCCF